MLFNKPLSLIIAIFILAASLVSMVKSAGSSIPGDEEIALFFYYPAAGEHYITAVYSDEKIFLPLLELFSILGVYSDTGSDNNSLKGVWLQSDKRWSIDFLNFKAGHGSKRVDFTRDDFRTGKLDYYLSPDLFSRIFGIRLKVDLSYLKVVLECDEALPVEIEKRRHQKHLIHEQQKKEKSDFPLLFPRKRSLLSEGTMDYSLGFIKGYEMQNYNYSVSGGLELLGGDFRTTVSGYHSNLADVLDLRFINWRYVPEPNGYLTEFCVGNIVTSGMLRRPVLGMALSNEPVIPPEVQSLEILDGYTDPGSEIELYINSRLYDFTLADENGYYRFEYDLRYGSASISLHIYKPSGETVIKNSRVDMPFSLLPQGKLYYNIQGGVIDDIPVKRDSGNYVFHGDVGYALFKNITARIGADYYNKYTTPAFYTGLSARVLNNVFFDVDHSPHKFSRAGTRVRYHSGAGAKILYTMFEGNGIYNEGVARRRVNAGFYLPFTVFNSHNGFRADCEQEEYDDFSNTRCSFSLSSRLKRLTLRTDYSGQFSAQTGPLCYHGGFISLAAGYMFSHLKGIPLFLRGMYFYAEWQGEPADLSSGNAGFRVSRSLWSNGQLGFQLYYDRNNNKMNIQSTVCIDLKPFRLVNRFSGSGRSGIMRQKVHGSLTLDAANRKIITSNRPQTGRSGVAVIMFVDANSNGCFDEGELIVPSRAIHLDQSANYELGKDGVLRINNLTGYRKYNAEIIREYMPDPLLAPKTMRFSFITDPNRFKQIEVPLYRTGVLEGKVTVCDGKDSYGQGGIRLIIKGMNNMFEKTIRTFSDGTFYCMGIMPGHYTLEADPVQCDLLNAESVPGIHEFEVKAVAGGDFVKRDIIINSGEISR